MEQFLHVLLIIGSVLFMVVFFGACIFIHELGHFIAGRLCGLKILAFSIGFGKVWGKTINGVEYRIGWMPFGGYVDLPQIDSSADEIKLKDGTVLPRAEPWKRIVTAFAGPLFNILFGLLLGVVIWIVGLPQDSPKMTEFKVKSVEKVSPEYEAGLRAGDVIVRRNGKQFKETWSEFVREIMLTVGDTTLTVERDGKELDVTYRPGINKKVAPGEDVPYPFFRPEIPVMVSPLEGSAAEKAGIQDGDQVVSVNGIEIYGADVFHNLVFYSMGKPLEMELIRKNGEKDVVTVIPEKVKTDLNACMTGVAFVSEKSPVVRSTMPGLPAYQKLLPGDVILTVNGKDFTGTEMMRREAEASNKAGTPLHITYKRGDKVQETDVNSVWVQPYQIGVSLQIMTHPNPIAQLNHVVVLTWRSLKSLGAGLGRKVGMKTGYTAIGPQHLSGPVGIGKYLYLSIYRGSIMIGLNLVVLLTFNLGLLNLLPIPILDGGHIFFAILEMIFRRPIPAKVLQPIAYTFITLLLGFMLLVTFFDVKKLLPVSWFDGSSKTEKTETKNVQP